MQDTSEALAGAHDDTERVDVFSRFPRTRPVRAYRPGLRLAELAVQVGYFDRSHFVHEVRAFMGLPPSQLFRDERCLRRRRLAANGGYENAARA